MRRLAAGLALALCGAPLFATEEFSASARGTTAAEFLNLGAGARAMAMGGAYAAAADDASAVYWNPAAMTQVERRSVSLMHAAYLDSSFYDYGAYVENLDKRFGVKLALGGAFQYFSAGPITQTDVNGAPVGDFNPYDMALHWSLAYELGSGAWLSGLEGCSFGLSAKLIDSQILTTASAGAVDVGLLSKAYWDGRLRVGLTAANLGGDTLQFGQLKEGLPIAFDLGGAFKISGRWLATADVLAPRGDRTNAAVGTEYWFASSGAWRFAGRAGFNSRTVGSIDGVTGFSAGFGIAAGGAAFDYAFVPLGGLGQAHRVSLTYNF